MFKFRDKLYFGHKENPLPFEECVYLCPHDKHSDLSLVRIIKDDRVVGVHTTNLHKENKK